MDTIKKAAFEAIDNSSDSLFALSQDIWKNPEILFEEHHAHSILCEFLEDRGFAVQRNYKLDTAFLAVIGNEHLGPNVAVLCEYDALPGIGHGCGHNLIAEIGVAVGLGVKAAFDAAKKPLGQLSVIGTPAEEGGGGKIMLIDGGIFSKIDVALMAHPSPTIDELTTYLCRSCLTVKYYGKASHASASPWDGVNALDAAVTCYQTISNFRHQMKPTWRVHGIIKNGGQKPNIIPEFTEMEYYLRTPSRQELDVLKCKVLECVDGAAKTTGCKVEYAFSKMEYLNVVNNKSLYDNYTKNLKSLLKGTDIEKQPLRSPISVSTDMGNLSHVVPSIHPMIYIGCDAPLHTRDFKDAAGDTKAQTYVLNHAKALSETAIDVFTKKSLLEMINKDFKKDVM